MKAKKIAKKCASQKTAAKPVAKKPVASKRCRKVSSVPVASEEPPTRKVKVKVPVSVMKEIRGEAKRRGIPVDAMMSLRLTVNVMLEGLYNKSEYERGIRFVEQKFHVKIDRSTIPAYKKGGDPEYKKWHKAQLAKMNSENSAPARKTSKGKK